MGTLNRSCLAFLALVLVLPACGAGGADSYLPAEELLNLRFAVHREDVGVYPSKAVLKDPNNPFWRGPVGDQTKWQLNDDAGAVGAFYCWATMLVFQPSGEHQLYAGQRLADVHRQSLAESDDLPTVHEMAIAALQSVLDNFPTSVSYLANGVASFRLAPVAYEAIISLGGTVQGDWAVVATDNGGTTVVPAGL